MSSGGLSEHLSSPISGQSTHDVLVLSFSVFRPKAIIFSQWQIAQFDCSVCTGEEADETRTDRDDPRRIDIGHNSNVDEPSLQNSTANCTQERG
jgi:hypothetical protein